MDLIARIERSLDRPLEEDEREKVRHDSQSLVQLRYVRDRLLHQATRPLEMLLRIPAKLHVHLNRDHQRLQFMNRSYYSVFHRMDFVFRFTEDLERLGLNKWEGYELATTWLGAHGLKCSESAIDKYEKKYNRYEPIPAGPEDDENKEGQLSVADLEGCLSTPPQDEEV